MTDAAKQTELEWIEARLKQLRMDEDHIRQARQEALARAAQLLTAFPIGTVLAVSSGLTKVNYVRLTSVTASEGWGRGGLSDSDTRAERSARTAPTANARWTSGTSRNPASRSRTNTRNPRPRAPPPERETMEQQQTTTQPEAAGSDAFLHAAWRYAADSLREKGEVLDVMILGRYADAQLTFVFPSGQDREAFAKACEAEAATFGADIAMMAREATVDLGGKSVEIVAVHWRERGQLTRVQYAPLAREGLVPMLGPISSLPGIAENEFVDRVFGKVTH